MKSEEEIVKKIMKSSRRVGIVEAEKDFLLRFPIENTEKSRKSQSEKLLEYDSEINFLEAELSVLSWLFEGNNNEHN